MSHDRGVYLVCIYDCIQRIRRFTSEGREYYFEDIKTQDAVMRNIEIIGQAVKDFGTQDLAARIPSVPWKSIAGMRDMLAHRYLGVDVALTWEVVERDLEAVKTAIETVAFELGIHLPAA